MLYQVLLMTSSNKKQADQMIERKCVQINIIMLLFVDISKWLHEYRVSILSFDKCVGTARFQYTARVKPQRLKLNTKYQLDYNKSVMLYLNSVTKGNHVIPDFLRKNLMDNSWAVPR